MFFVGLVSVRLWTFFVCCCYVHLLFVVVVYTFVFGSVELFVLWVVVWCIDLLYLEYWVALCCLTRRLVFVCWWVLLLMMCFVLWVDVVVSQIGLVLVC